MAGDERDETQEAVRGVPAEGQASAPDGERGVVRTEGGRGEPIDPSPEGSIMHSEMVVTSEPAPLPPDVKEERLREIDDREASEAANDVRRREHSAD